MRNALPNITKLPTARLPRRVKASFLGGALLLGLLLMLGCAQGSYPLDVFYEMHYQKSFKAHEPPRLSVPETAVGWYPAPAETIPVAHQGQRLFDVNCVMCHGVTGQGNGTVLTKMMDTYGYTPAITPDLTSQTVRDLDVVGIQGFISGGLVVMPSFSKLLTEDEMRVTAEYVVNCLQGNRLEACP